MAVRMKGPGKAWYEERGIDTTLSLNRRRDDGARGVECAKPWVRSPALPRKNNPQKGGLVKKMKSKMTLEFPGVT